jgi:hypothetical protein
LKLKNPYKCFKSLKHTLFQTRGKILFLANTADPLNSLAKSVLSDHHLTHN